MLLKLLCCCCCCCRRATPWKYKVKFRLHIKDISFTQNDYFLAGSTYTIFLKKKKRKRIKSLNVVRTPEDLSCLEINETLKIRTTLKQDLPSKYLEQFLPVKKKVVIRQVTKQGELESLYKDVGYIYLNLHEIAKGPEQQEMVFTLIDPDSCAEATIRVDMEYFFVVPRKLFTCDLFACCRKKPKQLTQDRWSANKSFFDELARPSSGGYAEADDEDDISVHSHDDEEQEEDERAKATSQLPQPQPQPQQSKQEQKKPDAAPLVPSDLDELGLVLLSDDDFLQPPSPVRLTPSLSAKQLSSRALPAVPSPKPNALTPTGISSATSSQRAASAKPSAPVPVPAAVPVNMSASARAAPVQVPEAYPKPRAASPKPTTAPILAAPAVSSNSNNNLAAVVGFSAQDLEPQPASSSKRRKKKKKEKEPSPADLSEQVLWSKQPFSSSRSMSGGGGDAGMDTEGNIDFSVYIEPPAPPLPQPRSPSPLPLGVSLPSPRSVEVERKESLDLLPLAKTKRSALRSAPLPPSPSADDMDDSQFGVSFFDMEDC